MTETTAPVRRRRRATTARSAATPEESLNAKLEALYALKVASDEAEAAFKKGKADFAAALKEEHKTQHSLPARGDRPAVVAGMATRDTTTINPRLYRNEVDETEFMDSISVTMKEAKKYLGDKALEKVSTTTKSAPYLNVRVQGKSRK